MSERIDLLHLCYLEQVKNEQWNDSNCSSGDDFDTYRKEMATDEILWTVELVLCVLSTVVSCLNMVIFTRRSMMSLSINVLLLSLETSNILFSVLQFYYSISMMVVGRYTINKTIYNSRVAALLLSYATVNFYIWITVSVAAWRLIAVLWPLKASRFLVKRNAVVLISCLTVVSLIPSVALSVTSRVRGLNICICSEMNSKSIVSITAYQRGKGYSFKDTNRSVLDDVVSFNLIYYSLPCVSLFVIIFLLFYKLHKSRDVQRRLTEGQHSDIKRYVRNPTALLILTIAFFLSMLFPGVIRLFYQNSDLINETDYEYTWINVFLAYPIALLVNCFSFFIYYCMSSRFRDASKIVLPMRFIKRSLRGPAHSDQPD